FAVKRRTPRVAGENGGGSGLPGAVILNVGSVIELSLKPLVIIIVHSPGCGNVNSARYSPRASPPEAFAVAFSPPAAVARMDGRNPSSRVRPCWRTVKVRLSGFPATA